MINIGLIGLGNVGQSVYEILLKNDKHISNRVGTSVSLKKIVVRNKEKYKKFISSESILTDEVNDVLDDPDINVIVELIGGEFPAYDYIIRALKNKKYVVTANKEVMAKHKFEFFSVAKQNGVDIFYEAAVGGGIPIIRSLKVGFAANKIHSLYGILNGTTNYILSKIETEKKEFSQILKNAQDLGFAEQDPTMDISGLDAAYKLVILAAVAFKIDIQLNDIQLEGISNIALEDIDYALELGYRIKLLANAERQENLAFSFSVRPVLIPTSHPLAGVSNEFNAAYIVGNYVGESMLLGKGAGGSPTASAVVSDIMDICFDYSNAVTRRNLELQKEPSLIEPPENISSKFYWRLHVEDKPGVLEKITLTFATLTVSLDHIRQKPLTSNQAELVIITKKISQKTANSLKKDLLSLAEVISVINQIPVANF